MDHEGALAIAVEAMYLLTLLPWEGALREIFPVTAGQIREHVAFIPTAAPDADEQMETQYMAIGLLATCLYALGRHPEPYFEVTATLKMRGEAVGLIQIGRQTELYPSRTTREVNSTALLPKQSSIDVSSISRTQGKLADMSGTIADPADASFEISYRFLGRQPLRDRSEFFLAALDALSNAAPHDPDALVQRLAGADPRSLRNAKVSITSVTRPAPRARELTYHYASNAIKLIVRLIKLSNNFLNVEIQLRYRGEKFGEGRFEKPRFANEVDEGSVDTL
ncbi:MAG: hypothetical protein Q9183_001080 [Haloplaca sp. 2 TL-2023]